MRFQDYFNKIKPKCSEPALQVFNKCIVYCTIKMLKKFGQRPGVRRTFRFSSRTTHAFNNFFYELYIFFYNLISKTMRNKTTNNKIKLNKN